MKSFLVLSFLVAFLALVGANFGSDSTTGDSAPLARTPGLSPGEEMDRRNVANETKWTKNLESVTQKLTRLSALKQGSPEWVALSREASALLRGTPEFKNKSELVGQYRSLVGPFWIGSIDKAADALKKVTTDRWVTKIDLAFLESGSNIETSAKREKGGYIAYVQYPLMSRALAYRIANLENGTFLNTARQAGFEKVVFKNTISGTSWTYENLGGSQYVKGTLLAQTEKEHFLK